MTASNAGAPAPPPSGIAKGLERALGLEPLPMEPRWTPGSSLLLNPRRLEILLTAAVYPGVHLRSASKLLLSPLPSLRFHVRTLAEGGLVRARRIGSRVALFLPGMFPAWAEPILAAWQDPLDRQVLRLVEHAPGIAEAELLRHLVASHAVLGRSLGRLEACGAVSRRTGRDDRTVRPTARWSRLQVLCETRVADRLQSFLGLMEREGLHPAIEEMSTTRARFSLDGPRFRIRLTFPMNPLSSA